MANIWLDPISNDENRIGGGGVGGAQIKANNLLSAKTQSVKKQAFGELNNIMRNQQQLQAATPFKSGLPVTTEVFPSIYSASKSKSLCKEVLRKEHSKKNVHGQLKLEHLSKAKSTNLAAAAVAENTQQFQEENLFDFWDFPSVCSDETGHKSETEIWSEMNAIGDDILNKVLHGGDPDSDIESACDPMEMVGLHDFGVTNDLLGIDDACGKDDEDDDYIHVLPLELRCLPYEIDNFFLN